MDGDGDGEGVTETARANAERFLMIMVHYSWITVLIILLLGLCSWVSHRKVATSKRTGLRKTFFLQCGIPSLASVEDHGRVRPVI